MSNGKIQMVSPLNHTRHVRRFQRPEEDASLLAMGTLPPLCEAAHRVHWCEARVVEAQIGDGTSQRPGQTFGQPDIPIKDMAMGKDGACRTVTKRPRRVRGVFQVRTLEEERR